MVEKVEHTAKSSVKRSSTQTSIQGETKKTSFVSSGDEEVSFTDHYEPDLQWTEEEEKKVRRIIDIKLLPVVLVMSFVLNMDRTNLSNAISDNLAGDLGFTNDHTNNGILLYAIMFTIFTLPSNPIAKRIGAHIWIPILMNAWGILTWAHVFLHNYASFMVVRALIGAAEAGFIPACLTYLTGWYKTKELATRLACFWGVQSLASAISGLMSFGVFRLRGVAGLEGWKWLFLIDGILTHVVAIFATFWLPSQPGQTASWFRGRKGWFDEKQIKIAVTRLIRDDKSKTDQHAHVKLQDVKYALLDTKFWTHILITFTGMMAITPIGSYLPSIIRDGGFATTTANLLTMPSYIVNLIFSILIAYSSDKHGEVAFHALIGVTWKLAGFIALRALPPTAGRWSTFAAAMMTAAAPSWHGMHIAWMSSNLAPAGKRAFALGAIIGAANICSVPGSKIYAASDAPRFYNGNTINIAMQGVTLVLFLFQRYRYTLTNKYRERKWSKMSEEERQHYLATTTHVGSNRLDYRFRI